MKEPTSGRKKERERKREREERERERERERQTNKRESAKQTHRQINCYSIIYMYTNIHININYVHTPIQKCIHIDI